ncbi:MAG: EpsI family protein, partial [Chloroflexi bacterium]|nr:EpsI family protein [Chloroflexota bacterium]
FYVSFVLLVIMAGVGQLLPDREETIPKRTDFAEYPMTIGEWRGTSDVLASIYLDALKLSDYIMANYVNQQGATVNFYVAYYESQRKGESAHSPKSCMPGGGWELTDFGQHSIDNVGGTTISVNRTLIQLGEVKQVVYYWFPQRGRNLTNEYLVKWYLFWDSLTQSRTDGALVRLTSIVRPGQEVAEVDRLLENFIRDAVP